jgi:heme exporter protein D
MIANAVLGATVVMMALAFFVLEETKFLIPYKPLLAHEYAKYLWSYTGILFLNLVELMYLVGRKVFLKDTGRKLAHVEKQVRTSDTVSAELSERIEE